MRYQNTITRSIQEIHRDICYFDHLQIKSVKVHHFERINPQACGFNSSKVSTDGVLGWELYEKSGINADRLYDFLEKHITSKYKNKLIILDNASSHRNPKVKELILKQNHLLYAVPYQHFTNSIENYFSMLKSRLYKVSGEGEGQHTR